MIEGPIMALHFAPLAGLRGSQPLDLYALHNDAELFGRLLEGSWCGGNRGFNLDAVVVFPGGAGEDGYYSFVQVFRNGCFEAASLAGGPRQVHPQMPEQLLIWSLDMTKWFRSRSATILGLSKALGISGPAVVSFSMLHVGNYEISLNPAHLGRTVKTPDRDHLVAPEVWIENLETAEVDHFVRPLLDTLWQGFGRPRCVDYDAETGLYSPRRE